METYEAILKRRSIREYDESKHISDKDLELILRAGMAAPSALDKKPWEFYVIKDKGLQLKIRSNHEYYDRNSDLIVVVCGNQVNQSKETLVDYWIEDCSAAIENMMIEATSLNIGSLWCGIFPRMDRVKSISELLKLDKNIVPLGMVHLGYPLKEQQVRMNYDESKIHIIG